MKNKIIILDTETTDAEAKPWMIQLWYIVCDLSFNEIKRENLFFKAKKEITYWSMAIHHITYEILWKKILEDWRDEEVKKDIARNDFKDAYLIAHNSPFDKNVLDCNGVETDVDAWIDTYNISYSVYQDEDFKHNLQFLRYALKCTFSEEIDPHDALSDVIVLLEVFKKIFEEYVKDAWIEFIDRHSDIFDEMVEQTKGWIILRTWAFGKYEWQSFADTFKTDASYFTWMYNSKMTSWDTEDAVFNTISHYLKK